MFACAFLVGGPDEVHNVWCTDNITYSDLSRPACGAQGTPPPPSPTWLTYLCSGFLSYVWASLINLVVYLLVSLILAP